jgi:hypothetical protein
MSLRPEQFRSLIFGMRRAHEAGGNVMEFARRHLADSGVSEPDQGNRLDSTLVAYDLQAGTYVAAVEADPVKMDAWVSQVASLVVPEIPSGGTIIEVGVGEATTLSKVVAEAPDDLAWSGGFDLSWSRVQVGQTWLARHGVNSRLFVGDLFRMPFADGSVDVVYSCHSLEPNGGREVAAVAECLRVARSTVVLIEPSWERAHGPARARMEAHGYVRGLRSVAESLGAAIARDEPLDWSVNPLNPSGVLVLRKEQQGGERERPARIPQGPSWACPVSGVPLVDHGDVFLAPDVGLAYPVLRGVPLLRPEHVVVASGLSAGEFTSEPQV